MAIGLIVFEHFFARAARADQDRAVVTEVRQLVESPMTVAGSDRFVAELHPGRVVYYKRTCREADISKAKFFLHVFPQDPANLAMYRRQHGFVNLDFEFTVHGGLFDGACGAVVALPNYPIAKVRTGQFTSEGGAWKELWDVSLR